MKLSRLLLLSSIILMATAFFSVGYFHFDEHFQILEFAGLKLGITQKQNLPWEYHNQMRSAIQPAMVVGIHHVLKPLGVENPFIITLFVRLLSVALSFLAMFLLFKMYYKQLVDDRLKKWFIFLSFFLWMVIFNSVRFSSENWSGSLFIIAYSYYFLYRKSRLSFYFIVGLFCGLSFLFRFQIGFLIAGFLAWMLFVQKEKIQHLFFLAFGILFIFGFGVLIDRWYYEEWTISAYNYAKQFFLLGNKSGFTQESWWYYFKEAFLRAVPPFSLVYIYSLYLSYSFLREKIL